MAEYMIIDENNIITGIFCGEGKDDNAILLPDTHEVREGESLEFYNDDFTRKSEAELIKLGLSTLPVGYKLNNDQIVEMTFDDRIIAGLDPLPNYLKIVDGRLVEKTEDEMWLEKTPDEKASIIRQKRDSLLNEVDTLFLKYQEQVELGIVSENKNYYIALLQYKQALRDIPEQKAFPENVEYPELPKYKDYE